MKKRVEGVQKRIHDYVADFMAYFYEPIVCFTLSVSPIPIQPLTHRKPVSFESVTEYVTEYPSPQSHRIYAYLSEGEPEEDDDAPTSPTAAATTPAGSADN